MTATIRRRRSKPQVRLMAATARAANSTTVASSRSQSVCGGSDEALLDDVLLEAGGNTAARGRRTLRVPRRGNRPGDPAGPGAGFRTGERSKNQLYRNDTSRAVMQKRNAYSAPRSVSGGRGERYEAHRSSSGASTRPLRGRTAPSGYFS